MEKLAPSPSPVTPLSDSEKAIDEAEGFLIQREHVAAIQKSMNLLQQLAESVLPPSSPVRLGEGDADEWDEFLPSLLHHCSPHWRERGTLGCLCERAIPVFMQARFELDLRFSQKNLGAFSIWVSNAMFL